jgi:hypothetical protein
MDRREGMMVLGYLTSSTCHLEVSMSWLICMFLYAEEGANAGALLVKLTHLHVGANDCTLLVKMTHLQVPVWGRRGKWCCWTLLVKLTHLHAPVWRRRSKWCCWALLVKLTHLHVPVWRRRSKWCCWALLVKLTYLPDPVQYRQKVGNRRAGLSATTGTGIQYVQWMNYRSPSQQISSCSSLHKLIGTRNTGGKPSLIVWRWLWKRESLSFYCPERPLSI